MLTMPKMDHIVNTAEIEVTRSLRMLVHEQLMETEGHPDSKEFSYKFAGTENELKYISDQVSGNNASEMEQPIAPVSSKPPSVTTIETEQQFYDILEQAQNEPGGPYLVVVDFYATWCGPCAKIAPFVVDLSTRQPNVRFIKVDVDKLENVANKYNVRSLPTFLLLRGDKPLEEVHGAKEDELADKVQRLAGDSASLETASGKTQVSRPSIPGIQFPKPPPVVTILTVAQFDEYLQKAENVPGGAELVVVDFWASWCAPCKHIAPFVEKLATQYPKVTFLKVDVDTVEAIANRYQVRALPTFMFFRGTNKMDEMSGAMEDMLAAKVKKWSEDKSLLPTTPPTLELDLDEYIDKEKCQTFNVTSAHPLANAFSVKDVFMKSDSDSRLIIFIPFKEVVRIRSIRLNGPDTCGPKTVKLFVNEPSILDIVTCETKKAAQIVRTSLYDLRGKGVISLNFVKFQEVSSILLYVSENYSHAEATQINHLKLFGSPLSIPDVEPKKSIIVAPKAGMVSVINSEKEFEDLLEEANNQAGGPALVVVDFYASWCGPCKMIAPFVAQLCSRYPQVKFAKIDVDMLETLALQYKVNSLPTFIFLRGSNKVDELLGADEELLSGKVQRLVGEKLVSEAPSPNKSPTSNEVDLEEFIDKKKCECLNNMDEFPLANVLTLKSGYLQSDTDAQLIIFIVFKQFVKLRSLRIVAPDNVGPKTVKLFTNQANTPDFATCESGKSVQTLRLKPFDLKERASIMLNYSKFSNITSLTLFVKDNQAAAERTRIDHLRIFGCPVETTDMSKLAVGKKIEVAS